MGRSQAKSQERLSLIKTQFDGALKTFNQREFLPTDPLQIPHRYREHEDQEFTAFVSALFSFGNVKSILKILNEVLTPLGPRPVSALLSLSPKEIQDRLRGRLYRFFTAADIASLFLILRRVYSTSSQGIEGLFASDQDHLKALANFRRRLIKGHQITPGLKFMFPDPERGAAKRLHMFLRWVVRKDDVDLGLWKSISSSSLIVPLDTHVFEICRGVGLTQRKQPNLIAALEVTDAFRSWDPNDPLKYDFALCRLGILKLKKTFLTDFKALSGGF